MNPPPWQKKVELEQITGWSYITRLGGIIPQTSLYANNLWERQKWHDPLQNMCKGELRSICMKLTWWCSWLNAILSFRIWIWMERMSLIKQEQDWIKAHSVIADRRITSQTQWLLSTTKNTKEKTSTIVFLQYILQKQTWQNRFLFSLPKDIQNSF